MSETSEQDSAPRVRLSSSERRCALAAAAAQFVLLLDFTLPLPLAPDLVEPLGLQASSLGLLAAAYTGAAAVGGVLFAARLDHFDRRRALLVALVCLSLSSGLGALAPGGWSYAGTRVLAGLCGAPTGALLMALVTDGVAEQRRGRALSVVFSANALAAVLAMPVCLWLAERVSWRVGVGAVGILGLVVASALAVVFSAQRGRELERERGAAVAESPQLSASASASASPWRERLAHLLIFVTFAASVAMTANLSAFAQFNLGFPREDIPMLYLFGGLAALVMMKLSGPAVDGRGAFVIGSLAVLSLAGLLVVFVVLEQTLIGTRAAVICLLACMGARNVSLRTLTSRVPGPHRRGRFMSLQAAAQQLGAVTGALSGALLLSVGPGNALIGMPTLACLSITGLLLVPPLLYWIERDLRRARVDVPA